MKTSILKTSSSVSKRHRFKSSTREFIFDCEIRQRIRVGPYVVGEEAITGFHLSGFPTELHAAAVYRVEGERIVYARGLM